MVTMIKISDELWEYLNSQKDRDYKTFEKVIWRFIADDKYKQEVMKNEKDN